MRALLWNKEVNIEEAIVLCSKKSSVSHWSKES